MDTVTLIGRLLVSLAAVLGVMWLLARRVRRNGGAGDRMIDVLGRQQLSRTSSVAVVRVGEQALILGCTDTQVSVLGQTDLAAAEALVPAASPTPARTGGRHGRHTATAVESAEPRRARSSTRAVTGAGASSSGTSSVSGTAATSRRPALAGSALSPGTWRQTLESLRDLTARAG